MEVGPDKMVADGYEVTKEWIHPEPITTIQ